MLRLLILLCLSLNSFARLGDGVGNGGGIAENNFVFAYQTLGEYIQHAIAVHNQTLSTEELDILGKIDSTLIKEYQTKKQLVFLSGRKHPHIFIYPFNEVRIAVTGSQIGSVIYVNTDLLYRRVGNEIKSVTVTQAISVLVHEFGHHHGVKDEHFLNTIGAKVAKSVYKKFEKRSLRKYQDIYLQFANLGKDQTTQLLLTDSKNSFNLSKDLRNKTQCPVGKKRKGIEVWQSGWSKYDSPSWYLKNELVVYCEKNGEIKAHSEYEYLVFPDFIVENNKIYIKSFKSDVTECDIRTNNCLAKQLEVFNFLENKKYNFMEER